MRTTLPFSIFLALKFTACGINPTPTPTEPDSRPKADYKEDHLVGRYNSSKAQINALRVAIAKLRFPLPGGTVDRLRPVQSPPSGVEMRDVFANKNGLLAVNVWRYELNVDYALLIRQGHYADKTAQPLGSYYRDEGAEIVRRDKLPKFGF